jgi:hypothetical protein
MTFKPATWRPIAIVLSGLNLVGVGLAAGAAESWHAGVHAVLGLAFGLWAQRLHAGTDTNSGALEGDARLSALEADVGDMRRELSETQERVDFAERLLAQAQEARRVDPPR